MNPQRASDVLVKATIKLDVTTPEMKGAADEVYLVFFSVVK